MKEILDIVMHEVFNPKQLSQKNSGFWKSTLKTGKEKCMHRVNRRPLGAVLAHGINHLPRMSYRSLVRVALPAAVLLMAIALAVKPSKATIGVISRGDLSGNWQIALGGNTGCGLGTLLITVNLPTSGSGTATVNTHGQCGDSTLTGQSFIFDSLSSNGSGKVGITCGAGCGWTFNIQVAPDRSTFNLVDTTDPNNFLVGTAVHQ